MKNDIIPCARANWKRVETRLLIGVAGKVDGERAQFSLTNNGASLVASGTMVRER